MCEFQNTYQRQYATLIDQYTDHKEARIEGWIVVRKNCSLIIHGVRLRETKTFFLMLQFVRSNCGKNNNIVLYNL